MMRFEVKYRVLVMGLMFSFAAVGLQGQGLTERIYACFIENDMVGWVKVMDEMKVEYKETGSIEMLKDLAMAQYGYIAICVARDDEKEGKVELKLAEQNVELLLEHDSEWAEMYALKGALFAFKVGFDPYKFVVCGSSAKQQNAIAMKLDPLNPNVWMEKGNLELYWPDWQKDDAKFAAEAYYKSMVLFEKDEKLKEKNWLYLNTMNSLAIAYRKAELFDEADAIYRKILRVEPNIVWIRDRDYPKFRAKYM